MTWRTTAVVVAWILGTVGPAHADPPSPELAAITQTARNVARDGGCDAVGKLGLRVQTLDPDYYATVFAVDPVIAGCVRFDAHVAVALPPSMTPVHAPPPPVEAKDPSTALALSLGATAGGYALLFASPHLGAGGALVGMAGVTLGPTLGHIYAGHTWSTSLGVRLGGIALGTGGILVAATSGCLLDDRCNNGAFDVGTGMFVGGTLLYLGGTIGEIATAGDAARRSNRERGAVRWTLAPAPMSHGAGLAAIGRF